MSSGTRDQLLEAAGRVFAERGYEGATGKEICERAGVSAAAVNYHFGGMQALYEAVLVEARARLFSLEEVTQAIEAAGTPEARLRAIISVLAKATARPRASSWTVRLLGRELTAPRRDLPALDAETRRRAGLLTAVVGEFMGLPADHPAVARGCLNVIAPCLFLLIGDRSKLERLFPTLRFDAEGVEALTGHMIDYALAGLSAAGSAARAAG